MDKWIRDLINSIAQGLTSLVNAVAERIGWVYTVFIAFFIKVRAAFDRYITGLQHHLNNLLRVGAETLNTLRWIVAIRIPQVVGNAVGNATRYLSQLVQDVRKALQTIITNVTSWVIQQVKRIDAWITDIVRWAVSTVRDIKDTLTKVVKLVYALLTDPRRFATWAIDAIIIEALRWVDRNADALFMAFRQRAVAYTLRLAGRIEDMIARLL